MDNICKMIEREAKRLAFHILHLKSYDELITKVEYKKEIKKNILRCNYKEAFVDIELPENFINWSIDDLSERIIQPAIHALCDWKRAFNINTYK